MKDSFITNVQTAVGRLQIKGVAHLGIVSIGWTDEELSEEIDERFIEWIDKIRSMNFDVPFLFTGTHFQITVWKEIMNVPRGQTISYSELAKRIGKPKAVRAVATACGKNPLAILVPCHRIIGLNGNVGKYFWGSDRKKMLLEMESE
jgi:O-6-methylguanine DNA methyltransferase